MPQATREDKEMPAAKADEKINIPDKIGPYKIESLLKKGGMSLLFLGTHPKTEEPTTIKVLSPRYVASPEAAKRFLDEAEIIAMADHPNIVKLYGYGRWEGGLYIAMEFIEGISLRQYLLRNPLSLKRALEIIVDIAYALCHLHTHGVIHRDLKPENILVTETGAIKVIDFGIAQLHSKSETKEKEHKGRLIGTPIYMSPEQRDNPENVSYPSDIYSLGIIAYELILGKLCHGRIHISLMPVGMQKILSKTLQPNPGDRYEDVVDFIAQISEYMHSDSFKKEYQPIDQLSEITASMQQGEEALLPISPPRWPNASIAFSRHKGILLSGLYYDFFRHREGSHSVLCIEPLDKGVEGMLYCAVARGMAKSLLSQGISPKNLIKELNTLLSKDSIQKPFLFSFLTFNDEENSFHYTSTADCPLMYAASGKQTLLPLKANAPQLGAAEESLFPLQSHTWNSGDTLILTSYSVSSEEPENDRHLIEDFLYQSFKEFLGQPPEQLVASVVRRIRTTKDKALQENSITLMALVHVG